jgi:hypothetical protein
VEEKKEASLSRAFHNGASAVDNAFKNKSLAEIYELVVEHLAKVGRGVGEAAGLRRTFVSNSCVGVQAAESIGKR